MRWPDLIQRALGQPSGARFYRCALQVNPYPYIERDGKQSDFDDEAAYNEAIVQSCVEGGIEAIGITDHHTAATATGLAEAARTAGIEVFPGFEIESSEGIHFLCLFDPDATAEQLERYIGVLGVRDRDRTAISDRDAVTIMGEVTELGGVCVAAHADRDKGVLTTLEGQARVRVWTEPNLSAVALSRPVDELDPAHRAIVRNRDDAHNRERVAAAIHAKDVIGPEHLSAPTASCWIKMSGVSIEGLRQAFLDPDSRIRLHTNPDPTPHAELLAMAWQGGFLDGVMIHFNENLNVLVGGRGTGKSTVIESLRFVLDLDPVGPQAQTQHDGLVKGALQSGTKVSLVVRTHRPTTATYLVERSVPNPPVVRDEAGDTIPVAPKDLLMGAEIYGQHEVSELTNEPQLLTQVLGRFVELDEDVVSRRDELAEQLARSRRHLIDLEEESEQIRDRLEALPGLEETIKRYEDAGLEERLSERSLLIREERILDAAKERTDPVAQLTEQLRDLLPIDRAIVSDDALEDLPNAELLATLDGILAEFVGRVDDVSSQLLAAIDDARRHLDDVRAQWEQRRDAANERYEEVLRELQRDRVDGEEFIRLREQIERLQPLKERAAHLAETIEEAERVRHDLATGWEDVQKEKFRALERAAKRVSRQLEDRLHVRVTRSGNRQPLLDLIDGYLSGRRAELLRALEDREDLSLRHLAATCRAGRDDLVEAYDVPQSQAERLADAASELFFRIEELELPATTDIQLNVAPEGEPPVWQPLDALSTGQKATALILLLLIESDAPLVVDQPEDDLDNRFIVDRVVERMKEEKRRRQFVFATHNANIPVLGDAELIVGLTTIGEPGDVHATIRDEHLGSIDEEHVRNLVEDVLEGGREAFMLRRLKYGF